MKINEEVINGKMYFYHSAKTLDTAKYILNKQWRTNMGMYGNGVYGQQYADPESSKNKLSSSSSISRYKNMYGGSYRFKIRYDNPQDMFYIDLDAGKKVYGKGYDKTMANSILAKHGVPQNLINNIEDYYSSETKIPPISNSKLATDTVEGGLLGVYGFKGMVYHGNQDGKCVLYWYPNEGHLTVEGYSTDFGKTWIDYDQNNKVQVQSVLSDIQAKIDELSGHVNDRQAIRQQTGKIPALSIQGKDRDWVRIIECGDKSGYDFKNGNFTSGNLNQFANLVQKQINASKEPKRSNRYEIALKLLPDVSRLINI